MYRDDNGSNSQSLRFTAHADVQLQRRHNKSASKNCDEAGRLQLEDLTDEDCTRLKQLVHKTFPMCTINLIHRVNAPQMYGMYLLRKEELQSTPGYLFQEIILYHVTTKSRAMESLKSGLDWRRIRRSKYGRGVSFSDDADYANYYAADYLPDEADSRVIIMCTVLVNQTHPVSGKRKGTDLIIPAGTADTMVSTDGRVYVKFNDYDFYPLYFMYYQHTPELKHESKYFQKNSYDILQQNHLQVTQQQKLQTQQQELQTQHDLDQAQLELEKAQREVAEAQREVAKAQREIEQRKRMIDQRKREIERSQMESLEQNQEQLQAQRQLQPIKLDQKQAKREQSQEQKLAKLEQKRAKIEQNQEPKRAKLEQNQEQEQVHHEKKQTSSEQKQKEAQHKQKQSWREQKQKQAQQEMERAGRAMERAGREMERAGRDLERAHRNQHQKRAWREIELAEREMERVGRELEWAGRKMERAGRELEQQCCIV